MPEINLMDEDKLSPEMQELIKQARNGQIDIQSFFQGLEENEIVGFALALYACRAFGISLSQAKEAFIKYEYGSLSKWEANFNDLIEDIPDEKF